jgi:O-antigen/teichoic acid export membrane protein
MTVRPVAGPAPRRMLKSLLHDSGWNLSGYVLPAAAAFAATPFLFHTLGAERFGLLSLAWAVLGMATVFDLGIARALTRWIAELRTAGEVESLGAATATALAVAGALSIVVVLLLAAGAYATDGAYGVRVAPAVQPEVPWAVYLLILGIGATVHGSALRGGLEGFGDFRPLNMVKIPAGVAGFALPCLGALWTPDLSLAVGALLVSRLAANFAMARLLRRRITPAWSGVGLDPARALLRYGGWITVSSLVGPVIVYADRFVVSRVVSAAAVSYISVPSDALSRVLVLPVSMGSAAFPVIVGERDRAANVSRVVRMTSLIIVLAVVPLTVASAVFARPILSLWMGAEFAHESTLVFQTLAVGYGLNALAQVPFLALQALGRARVTAQWHLVQLGIYLVGLGLAAREFGVIGAAVAWTLRSAIDMLGMWGLLHLEMRSRR